MANICMFLGNWGIANCPSRIRWLRYMYFIGRKWGLSPYVCYLWHKALLTMLVSAFLVLNMYTFYQLLVTAVYSLHAVSFFMPYIVVCWSFSKLSFSRKVSIRNTIRLSNGSWSGTKQFAKVVKRRQKSPLTRKELNLSRPSRPLYYNLEA